MEAAEAKPEISVPAPEWDYWLTRSRIAGGDFALLFAGLDPFSVWRLLVELDDEESRARALEAKYFRRVYLIEQSKRMGDRLPFEPDPILDFLAERRVGTAWHLLLEVERNSMADDGTFRRDSLVSTAKRSPFFSGKLSAPAFRRLMLDDEDAENETGPELQSEGTLKGIRTRVLCELWIHLEANQDSFRELTNLAKARRVLEDELSKLMRERFSLGDVDEQSLISSVNKLKRALKA